MNSKNKGNRFERKIGAWFTKLPGFLQNGPGTNLKGIERGVELGIQTRTPLPI